VTGEELAALLKRGGIELLDVRSRQEYEGIAGYPCDPHQGHIPGAAHVDVNDIQAAAADQAKIRELLAERGLDPSGRIVAYCHSGQRSEIAAALLRAAGLDAVNYEGSWHEWSRRAAGLDSVSEH
jgi:thiosulfate/3-mercaptopyruvate sulfurtransferase